MPVIKLAMIENFTGLSTDTKPTGIRAGCTFFEYDTKDFFFAYDGTNWTKKKRNSDLDTNADWKKEN